MRRTFVLICSLFLICGCLVENASSRTAKIACGTPFLEELVRTLVGDDIATYQLQADSSNPLQYHPLSQEINRELFETQLVLLDPNQKALKRELNSKKSQQLKLVVLKTRHLNVPLEYYKAAEELKKILSKTYPQLATYIDEQFGGLKETISLLNSQAVAKGRELGFTDIPCLVHHNQKAFVSWLGFEIVGVFYDEELMNDKNKMDLVKKGKAKECWLVVASQPGQNISIANYFIEALEGEGLVLSTQPESAMEFGVPGWQSLLEENLKRINDAVVWH